MMNPTMFDPIALEQWCSDEESSKQFESMFDAYLHNYDCAFHSKCQRELFRTFIKGLFSPLERKSIEPIALHFLGEKSVRSLQQFFSRSPLDESELLNIYQRLLSQQISAKGSMLSVDDTTFVKKGIHSVGVKRQYCGRLGKTENCQDGVFLAYAGNHGYGLVDYELYVPQEWFSDSFETLRKECHLPEEKIFSTKNEIALALINKALRSGLFQVQWIGCDAAYGNDHAFLDGLELPDQIWYFAATNAKEQVFLSQPQMSFPVTSRGRPRKHPDFSQQPVSVKSIAGDTTTPWETVILAEGIKGPITAERKLLRCVACRKDENRNYVKPGDEIWLYLRKYEDGTIKYFLSNAPETISTQELDRAATLRWPIEQCFEECKSNLGMSHYECRSYSGWKRHMLFVMIAHLYTLKIREILKKIIPLTMPMVVKLMQEIMVFTVKNMKKIVSYHIRRNHIAYLSHRKKKLCCSL